ncbi:diphosphate--fructose-6-phosphate 1-phosphotransferase [Anaerococcus sp. AGMB09787]|uniref:diphosphate--fructose-6-phosphate 1-phosphotransferase n=1 Tax=Anaerococcus sp. AGMB09787 TaxID=2922869 RepID=UPI001FAF949B|nr:diphosphate--fructose-6-phosphate 1-phosphotransferase [Anaerococcus sp. AGMB09787]
MNYLIVHGGGPTAVINASLYGLVKRLKEEKSTEHIYGAIGGIEAIYFKNYVDFAKVNKFELESLLYTPASALGSSRYPLDDEEYARLAKELKEQGIDAVFLNGGNGTMNTCAKLSDAVKAYNIKVMGVPKTIDNDIAIIDHSPGYASAAKFVANTISEISVDIKSLPIHVCIVETMGRNSGWLAASASLAKSEFIDGPDFIYTPERDFDEDTFLNDVSNLWNKKKGILVVVSEGLVNKNGDTIVPPIYKTGRSVYYGDVSSYLSELVIKNLGIKARNEKPGLLGRCSISTRSRVDVEEAIIVGRKAADAIIANKSGYMVGIMREDGENYKANFPLIPIEEINAPERKMPDEFINESANGITEDFIKWAKDIVDFHPYDYVSYNKNERSL